MGVSLTNKACPWLPKVISAIATGPPESRLLPRSCPELAAEFNAVRERLRSPRLALCQCRHSGAPLDLKGWRRDHLERKNRGGWQRESPPKRRENAARLSAFAPGLSPWQLAEF